MCTPTCFLFLSFILHAPEIRSYTFWEQLKSNRFFFPHSTIFSVSCPGQGKYLVWIWMPNTNQNFELNIHIHTLLERRFGNGDGWCEVIKNRLHKHKYLELYPHVFSGLMWMSWANMYLSIYACIKHWMLKPRTGDRRQCGTEADIYIFKIPRRDIFIVE